MILSIIGYIIFYLFLIIGLGANFVGLPGTAIIFVDALIFSLITNFEKIHWKILIILGVMALAGELIEHLLTVVGAYKLGSSRRGVYGAVIGAIILGILMAPLFFGFGALIGAILGAFLGAFLMELSARKKVPSAAKVGIGSMFGRIAAIIIKLMLAVAQIGIIIWAIYF